MSTFKPDIFKNLKDKGYGMENNTISSPKTEIPQEMKDALVKQITQYGTALSADEKLLYDYSKLSIGITDNIFDTSHIMIVFSNFLLQSLKILYPLEDFSKLELSINDTCNTIKDSLKTQAAKDNELLIPVMIGMLEKMI